MVFLAGLAGCGGLPQRASPPAATAYRAPESEAAADPRRSEALLQALLALDVDYRYGGGSPSQGFDCSGLVAYVFQQAYGIRLPHSTQAQSELGTPVAPGDLEPGDLVFYDTLGRPYSHVGIYLGNGRFVHAPKTGARVRVESLRAGYWASRFSGARRIAPQI
jgi:cell wall-associated NlpC family hydrolase